ncbi:MAG TPA: aminoglycoside phosphotransferase family protein [Candidatus Competibacter sp.]|nr:hypothetical protein [Candidatus Competibacteraceae bacterium]HRE54188.1 aminoglycoside phosphotransferase family protein [Candidatus Competibacter sp.]HUM95417.1 aminoglycoside phosphotransferase family protein [Candidatus Competibacter sp.]
MFDNYLTRWGLERDGDPIVTASSRLLPVRRDGVRAILKIALEQEEKSGAQLMVWWDGEGAARVLARDDDALLLERAEDSTSLIDLVYTGRDDEASRIICAVVAKIHALKAKPLPELIPLSRWFRALEPAAEKHGGILLKSAATARQLIAAPEDIVALHGDIHHGNILHFGQRGWLVIDPKGLIGERGFDYANLFCNPDSTMAKDPRRFEQRLRIVGKTAGLQRCRLLQWILAWAGLSAAWLLGEHQQFKNVLAIAEMALAALIETDSPR